MEFILAGITSAVGHRAEQVKMDTQHSVPVGGEHKTLPTAI